MQNLQTLGEASVHHKTCPHPGDQGHQLGRLCREAEEEGRGDRPPEAPAMAQERDPSWKELQQGGQHVRPDCVDWTVELESM